jgi:hypothetical protein
MEVTATATISKPTATLQKMELFGNWILADGFWSDNGIWIDQAIWGRNYYTDPVAITSITITEITAIANT